MAAENQSIVLGGGCFWCLDAAFRMIAGVAKVTSGYAGGDVPDPSYEAVCSGTTGHAEVYRSSLIPRSSRWPTSLKSSGPSTTRQPLTGKATTSVLNIVRSYYIVAMTNARSPRLPKRPSPSSGTGRSSQRLRLWRSFIRPNQSTRTTFAAIPNAPTAKSSSTPS